MGIRGLGKFLAEFAPSSVKQIELKSLMGRVLAIDASMSLYQFLIAIRDSDSFGALTNEAGEATSHIAGFLARVVRLIENNIKPIYVFDGTATSLKSSELQKRRGRREEAGLALEGAKDAGDMEEIKKFVGRTVKVTQQHNDDVRKLLRLLGCPTIDAPNEAEAQCARMAAAGIVWATATDDADALTFGSPVLVRNLGVSGSSAAAKAKPMIQFTLKAILEELDITMDQFIDFCILCGCDYCDRLKGIGPTTAFKLIKQHKSIEKIFEADRKLQPPDIYMYKEAREFFKEPEVLQSADFPLFTWTEPDFEGLRKFLVDEHSFNPARVESYMNRLRAARKNSGQTRLESFFGAPIKVTPAPKPAAGKRKSIDINSATKKRKR